MSYITLDAGKIIQNYRKIESVTANLGKKFLFVSKGISGSAKYDFLKILHSRCGLTRCGETAAAQLQFIPKCISPYLLRFLPKDCLFFLNSTGTLCISNKAQSDIISQFNSVPDLKLVVEVGDLRDGINQAELIPFISSLPKQQKIKVSGLLFNFGCLYGTAPRCSDIDLIDKLISRVRRETGITLEENSIGGTIAIDTVLKCGLPDSIAELRIGEAVLLGESISLRQRYEFLYQETAKLHVEVLEVREKRITEPPPYFNSCGVMPRKGPMGLRKLAVLGAGALISPEKGIQPTYPGEYLLGSSHDHMVVDITDSNYSYSSGDYFSFALNYTGLAHATVYPGIPIQYDEENRIGDYED
ncbi:MAG: hypothetical protein ACLFR1_03160 [Spirochaetia bacterium]